MRTCYPAPGTAIAPSQAVPHNNMGFVPGGESLATSVRSLLAPALLAGCFLDQLADVGLDEAIADVAAQALAAFVEYERGTGLDVLPARGLEIFGECRVGRSTVQGPLKRRQYFLFDDPNRHGGCRHP